MGPPRRWGDCTTLFILYEHRAKIKRVFLQELAPGINRDIPLLAG
jgi:hypothetical protein